MVQWTDIVVGVFRGISTDGAGVVNVKPAPLTVSACVLVVPAAVAVMTSLPGALAVTTAVTWPEELVVPVAGEIEFPVAEARVIVKAGTATPAESFRLKVSVVLEPNARELLPLIVMAVPVTSTPVAAVAPETVAVTEIKRFDLLNPRLSLAVTAPFGSVIPLPLMLLMNAEGSVPVESTTVVPETAWPLASTTIAVRSTVVSPEEGICGLLAIS